MARTSLDLEANIRTNGTEQINQLSDSIRMSAEEARKFQELGDWTNATQEIQNIEAMKNSLAQLTQEQMNSQRTRPSDYSARSIYNEQQNNAREMLRQYGLDNPKGIEAYQKNYRQEEIARLVERIADLNDSIKDLDERIENTNKNDTERLNQLTETRKTTSDEKNSLENKLNNLLAQEKGGDSNNLGKYFGLKELGQVFQFAGNIAQAGFTYRQDIASGNVIGASRREKTSIANSIGGAATALGTGLAATGIGVVPGAIIAGLGMGTNFVSRLIEGKGQADDSEAQAYMNNFDAKYGALRSFRDVSGNESENTKAANEIFSKLTAASIGTGLDAATISQLVQEAAKQGVSENSAFNMANLSGKWNQETGADINTMMRLQGMAERYGLGQDVISTAYGGLKASGMQKAQLDEFLNGLQSVIEDGIANGYIKSTDDVAAQMTMFATLSGNNPLWTGQNAVNNIKQMNAGLSGATDMGSVAQNIAFASAKKVVDRMSGEDFERQFGRKKTNTYLDYEMALQNPTGALYGQVLKDVKSYSGGNLAAQKEFLQQIFGISSTGTLLDLINMTGGDFSESTYKNIIGGNKIALDAKTEQTSWSDSMNKLSESLNRIGEGEWQKNIAELNKTVQEYLGKGQRQREEEEKKANRTKAGTEIREANKQLYEGITPNGESFSELGYKAFSEKAKSLTGYSNNIWVDRFLAKDGSLTEYDTKTEKYKERKVQDNEKLDSAALNAFSYMALKNDGVITNDEIVAFRNALNSNRAANKAYTEGNEEAFAKALGQAIKTAFKEALPTEFKVYEGY